ncbi:methyl-accepting chemotaxis protein [Colwellia sp. Arc7-635]|uniref:methyl-accepting chemotaxis protein n=1 Tax=Colwellia sp. Arc7-635 TaxID=2497879 RepID=UPI000F85A0BD|nr:methyl-accepting chemotaxis protein [Colwellia sp. Arc7-635]AZQ85927.1 methyl-accepting chemotaxis protein [Colwellia sp. Arc7-635]
MYKFKKINHKLVFSFLTLSLLPLIIFAFFSIDMAKNAIQQQAFNQLESVRTIKKAQLTNYISSLKSSLLILDNDPYAAIALEKFSIATINGGINGSEWQQLEQQYGEHFKTTNQINAWYDLFLIDLKGNIVFSAAKESDLGMNINNSALGKSSLNDAFTQAQRSDRGTLSISDFKPYAPSNNEPAAFIMAKKYDENSNHIGYIALQFPIGKVNTIMQQRDGMGETGETYLVGQDKRMRSDSFLDPKNHSIIASFAGNIAENGVDTVAVDRAFRGESASEIITDYNGNSVLSSFTIFDLGTFQWALIAEIDESEAFATANTLIKISTITIIVASIVITLIGLLIAKNISTPIVLAVTAAQHVSSGDLTQTIEVNQHDELGLLQQAMRDMIVRLKSMIEHISASAEQQAAASQELSSITAQTDRNVSRQQQATDQVATAINEMSTSIDEVTNRTSEASDVADNSKRLVSTSSSAVNETIEEIRTLSESILDSKNMIDEVQEGTENIVNILVVIKGIADQTNLLALNAAIEAARAGEQGRGFAVVADEVRTLAQNTQKSTIEIENMIQSLESKVSKATASMNIGSEQAKSIVERTHEVTRSLSEVEISVAQISDMNIQIATATQQQSEVARDINQQAIEISDISVETGDSAKEISAASDELAKLAADLTDQVRTFKI